MSNPIDLSAIDTSSTLGQIAFLMISLSMLLAGIRQNFKIDFKRANKKRNYTTLLEENQLLKTDLFTTRKLNRALTKWQMTAREMIWYLRSALIDHGDNPDSRVPKLQKQLEEIEDELTWVSEIEKGEE